MTTIDRPPPGTAHATSIRCTDIACHFGEVRAVDGVTLQATTDEILGLVGANGSGKTTLLNVMSGLLQPTAGTIQVGDTDLTGRSSRRFNRSGIARTFQEVRLFERFTTRENLEVAARAVSARRRDTDIDTMLARFDLGPVAGRTVADLPYGTRRRISIARALLTDPQFLLLDEPAAGMNTAESEQLGALLKSVHEEAESPLGVIIVEHDMDLVLTLCHRVVVLIEGHVLAEGTPAEIIADESVQQLFLGTVTDYAEDLEPEPTTGLDNDRDDRQNNDQNE